MTVSIIQQVRVIGWYRDVVTEQFEGRLTNPNNPDNAITNGSGGMDLVLSYIRRSLLSIFTAILPHVVLELYLYNVESMLVLFWYVIPILDGGVLMVMLA